MLCPDHLPEGGAREQRAPDWSSLACTDPSSILVSLQGMHNRFIRGARSYKGKGWMRRQAQAS